MRKQAGFTLIELMTTLAVAAIILALGVPALSSFTSNARQTSAVNDFVSSMHLARNTAISTNTRVTICASDSGTGCESVSWDRGWILFADPDGDRAVDPGETIIRAADGIDGLSVQTPDFGQAFMFRPNGRAMAGTPADNTGEFTVCDNRGADYAKVVIIDRSGRPRVSETLAGGGSPTCG